MLTITVTRTIARSSEDILAFVMDAEAYQRVDAKMRPVRWGAPRRRRHRVRVPGPAGRVADALHRLAK